MCCAAVCAPPPHTSAPKQHSQIFLTMLRKCCFGPTKQVEEFHTARTQNRLHNHSPFN